MVGGAREGKQPQKGKPQGSTFLRPLDRGGFCNGTTPLWAAYVAARCYGMRGSPWACMAELSLDAHAWAFRMTGLQAGVRS